MSCNKKYSKIETVKLVAFFVILIVLVAAGIFLFPFIKSLMSEEGRLKIQETVAGHKTLGIAMFVGLQVLQIIVAIIPGEPIEIIGGVLFGPFLGMLLCLLGILIGTIIIFYMIKLLGYPFISAFFNDKKISKFKFLHDQKKLETLVFILFLIPGTPKDLLTYIIPLTKIKPLHFFLYATLARIPSIISSTFLGSSLSKGNFVVSLIIFLVTGCIGLVGILYNNKLISKKNKKI